MGTEVNDIGNDNFTRTSIPTVIYNQIKAMKEAGYFPSVSEGIRTVLLVGLGQWEECSNCKTPMLRQLTTEGDWVWICPKCGESFSAE